MAIQERQEVAQPVCLGLCSHWRHLLVLQFAEAEVRVSTLVFLKYVKR